MEKFKIGDVVVLKSGGPKMTVAKDYNNGNYHTNWFTSGTLKWNDFEGQTLTKVYQDDKIEIDIHNS
ncbi:YodC family protein [Flavobacterium sp. AG291]|uniref:YodC family protein n=1 Tax=Flavobacterium sp. AG291 TaxID=2184000 RepID=UPI000E0B04E4|nr:DUF2158 domain-containing protein [Flavobacterium sp. AG291]RDI13206.1 uncharacterized protein YodC (DUF2158 family) [Flavobacterium sp. AG291]